MNAPRAEQGHTPDGDELARLRSEFGRRSREVAPEEWRVRLLVRQLRERALLSELSRAGILPLDGRRILDVGCGVGQGLADLETWGAARPDLAGIELEPGYARFARARLAPTGGGPEAGEADIREGNAAELPWPDGSFDVVLQATVLSSLIDPAMRRQVAREMMRMLAPGGAIVSYDMRVGNPRNPCVQGISKRELEKLFAGFTVRARRVTLALPLTRRLARAWGVATVLEQIRILDTHLLAILRRPDQPSS